MQEFAGVTGDLNSSTCIGTSFRYNGIDYYLSDFKLSTARWGAVMTRNGFNVAQASNQIELLGAERSYQLLGGWSQRTMFLVFPHLTRGSVEFAITDGNLTEIPVPTSGIVTYTGVMLGADLQRSEAFMGDANIVVNFDENDLDVVFDNIREVNSGDARNPIWFADVPIRNPKSDPEFWDRSYYNSGFIEGRFFGPNHSELGGLFATDRQTKIGSFGAKR